MKTILETRDLRMVYQVGKMPVQALRGVNLTVNAGEFISIMGPSGCGKSTLLHLLGGLLTPTAGEILIDGANITRLSDAQRTDLRRRKIGFVFQRFNLFPTLTAEGNLKLAEHIAGGNDKGSGNSGNGHGKISREKILKLLRLQDKLHHKPIELSGGEQQRVALARAVINSPSIVLADEPTGNLDSENSEIVLTMLRDLNKELGQTIVMITHNPEAAGYSQRVIEMKDGRIIRDQ